MPSSHHRYSAIEIAGNNSHGPKKTGVDGQQTYREAMHRLQERSAKNFSDPTYELDDLVHQLSSRTRGPVSGCPLVVMVQPTHDWKSDHLVPCILRGRNRSALFRLSFAKLPLAARSDVINALKKVL
jgi:hypothetical protein